MRLIDADELIKVIDMSADMGGALGKVIEVVKLYAKLMAQTMPTIEPEPKWIPCSVSLPGPDKRCLVTLPLIGGYPFVRILTYGHTEEEKLCWHEKDYDADIEMYGVTAWMPLPEPFNAKMEEEG